MPNTKILNALTGKDSKAMIWGLNMIQKMIDEFEIKEEDAELFFNCLIPLLKHNHYKIRKLAFDHAAFLLDRFSDNITLTYEIIPHCLAALVCKDEKLADPAQKCLEFLLDLEDPKYWWSDCEKILTTSKSPLQRTRLFHVLHDHYDEVPIRTVIILLRDPLLQIQRLAYEMLMMNDPEIVKKELEACKKFLGIHFDAQEFIDVLKMQKSHQELTRRKRKKAKDAEREIRRQQAEQAFEAFKLSRESSRVFLDKDKDKDKDKGSDSNPNISSISPRSPTSQTESIFHGFNAGSPLNSPRNMSSPRFSIEKIENNSAKLTRGDYSMNSKTHSPSSFSGMSHLSASMAQFSKKLSQNRNTCSNVPIKAPVLHVSTRMIGRPPIPMTSPSAKSNSSNAKGSSEVDEKDFDRTYPSKNSYSALFDNDHTIDSLLDEIGELDDGSPKSKSTKNTGNMENQTLGKIPKAHKESLPFKLVDLRNQDWEYRKTYLEKVHNTLATKKNLSYRADFLMDCVIVAAKPPHKRVAPVLASVLTDIILANPEIAPPFLNDIVHFLMQSQSMFPIKIPIITKSNTNNNPNADVNTTTVDISNDISYSSNNGIDKNVKKDNEINTTANSSLTGVTEQKTKRLTRSTISSSNKSIKSRTSVTSSSRLNLSSRSSETSTKFKYPKQLDDLTDALFLEVRPSDIIMSILEYKSKASVHPELLLQNLYSQVPNVKLNYNEMTKLIGFLCYEAYPTALRLKTMNRMKAQPWFMEAIEFILEKISQNQPNLFYEVAYMTTIEEREILLPFIKDDDADLTHYNKNNSLNNSGNSNNETNNESTNSSKSPKKNPMLTILRELKKGNNCDLSLIANMFEEISFSNPKHRFQMYMKILKLFASLSDKRLDEDAETIRKICFLHFTSVKLLSILALKNLESCYIQGLSRFVWYCPKYLLNDAHQYYPNMYKLFVKSDGSDRDAIAIIANAIQRVSKKSMVDLSEIVPSHKMIIARLLEQYNV